MRLFGNPLDSLAHPSLGSLDRRAVPFEGLLDFAGQGRFAGRHIVNELFFGGDLHARVVLLLVAERRDRLPVVVTGKDANLISEGFEFRQTVVLPLGVPSRQIGPAAAANQKRVTGKDSVSKQEAHGILGVTRRVDDFERQFAEFDLVAVVDSQVHVGRLGGAVHDDLGTVALAHYFAGGIMVGMGMGVDGVEDGGTEKTSQLDVIVGFVYFRIDDNTDVVLFAAEDIRETATGTDLFEKDFLASHASRFIAG